MGGGGLPPVCGGYVHTGSPQTRINDSVFKKSNMMSYQWKKQKNIQTYCTYVNNLCKSF